MSRARAPKSIQYDNFLIFVLKVFKIACVLKK